MPWVVGGRAMLDLAASTSQMGRFETGAMTSTQNLTALADVSGRSAAPAGGPTCVRGLPCDRPPGAGGAVAPRVGSPSDSNPVTSNQKSLAKWPPGGPEAHPEGGPAPSTWKCRVECVRWPMCAACADNSARVPEYRQPPSRRVDDLVCPQPPPRYRAAPSHGAQSSHGGSSSTGVRVAGRARPASRAVRRGTERSAP